MSDISTLAGLHTSIEDFEVRDTTLCVGGETVSVIAEKIGQTPFYAYDKSLIIKRINHLRDNIPETVLLHYAMKANPMPEVVKLVAELVDGLDVASAGELEIALETDTPPREISFAGPGKNDGELRYAIDADITINVESAKELDRIVAIAEQSGVQPRVALRVNPSFELKSSGMQMSGGPKQFGIDDDQVSPILRNMAAMPVEFVGFHIFSGSQNLSADAICESQNNALELAIELSHSAPGPLQTLNIGGGLGIPYFPGDKPLKLDSISDNLEILCERAAKELGETQLILELGRFVVGEAGVYVCKVIDKKISRGRVFLITDGGLHHHLAASGNFGQVIRKNYPVAIANRIGSTDIEEASVVGPLCTPLDLLANGMPLARADVGDLVAVFQSGAYGFSASPHLFLSHPVPSQVLL